MSDNTPVYNETHSLFQAYRFEVSMNDHVLGFQRVSGLKLSAAYEPLMVGGHNDGPVMLRVPVKDNGRLILERGKYYAGKISKFSPGQALPEPMSIKINSDYDKMAAVYKINKPVLESIELSGLDASDGSVLIEKFTVAHQGIN